MFTNADTPEDAAEARRNGAEGIGLVRTEHMFFATEERLKTVRQMIMAENLEVSQMKPPPLRGAPTPTKARFKEIFWVEVSQRPLLPRLT